MYWYYDTEAHREEFPYDNIDKIKNDLSEFFHSKLPKETKTEQLTKENKELKKKVKELEEQLKVHLTRIYKKLEMHPSFIETEERRKLKLILNKNYIYLYLIDY